MSVDPQVLYNEIIPHITSEQFNHAADHGSSEYFPEVLQKRLEIWFQHYQDVGACAAIDDNIPFADGRPNVTLTKCARLIDGINKAVQQYYMGDLLGATQVFNDAMESDYKGISKLLTIPEGRPFYRARLSDPERHFDRKDLFHVPFEKRNFVSTNRYSVPGFPALYLGDTSYVCWEETGRSRLRDLAFSCFRSSRELNLIEINWFPEFYAEMTAKPDFTIRLAYIMRFVCTFPLIVACTCQVKERKGTFKPEYIIPQLLLQYVSQRREIDGIKFPSTRIDYSRLFNVEAYNYVFPVKTNSQKGFCNELKKIFTLTQPTSLELEEVIHNPLHGAFVVGAGNPSANTPSIELVKGVKSFYRDTSFGRLENIVSHREFAAIE
jgi:RES domain